MPKATLPTTQDRAFAAEATTIVEWLERRVEELPPEGAEFGASVLVTARSILATINAKRFITPAQYKALNNMSLGVEKWFHDRELNS